MSGHDFGSASPRPVAVPSRRLSDLATRLGSTDDVDLLGGPATELTGITLDSRHVRPGDLYAALSGEHTHGARFAADAVAGGAVAIMTDAYGLAMSAGLGVPVFATDRPRDVVGPIASWLYGDPSSKLKVLGVTGTNGKTTTTYLLDAGLRAAGIQTGLIGTIDTRIGAQSMPSSRTTPEAPDLQASLAIMAERGVTHVAMEVSSHALALRRVDGTRFDVAAFTNLSQDHLDFHASLDDYFAAKARLFSAGFARAGIVNVDDAYGRRLVGVASIPMTTVSVAGNRAQWQVRDVQATRDGSRFTVVGPHSAVTMAIRLPGAFNVANAALALVTLLTAGVDAPAAASGIGDLAVVPGRMEPVSEGQPFTALVDYAHTPAAVETLLMTLRPTTEGRLIVVLGCGGDRDRAKRPMMGAAAARLADVVVLTSDNPRSEDPAEILSAAFAGAMSVAAASRGEVIVEVDRSAAIATAVAQARPGDVVVVAGKGHEQGQEVAGVVYPFDDRAVLRSELVLLRTRGAV